MWRIIRIGAKNIVSFKKLEYDIHQGVATLIFGENLDGTNQRHNGSGKSALIEAISLALTGDYLRDVKTTEELINDDADACMVSICLENDFDGTLFTIKRTFSRKEAQIVECHQYEGLHQEEINTDKTVQPTVNDYNKFILSEIGLSKDDIYSNFILCRNKYVSFLSAKDKDKKELINRFSNGIIVDESIEALEKDMEPVKAEVDNAHDEVVRYNARVETINEQIANEELNKAKKLQDKAESIQYLQEKIAQKRAEIRETKLDIENANKRLDHIDGVVGDELEKLEKSDKSFSECFAIILERFRDNQLPLISDYSTRLREASDVCIKKEGQLTSFEKQLVAAKKNLDAAQQRYEEVLGKHKLLVSDAETDREKYQEAIKRAAEKITDINILIEKANESFKKNRSLRIELATVVDGLKVKLNGAIICPKCNHKFVLKSDVPFDTLERQLEQKVVELKDIDKTINDVSIDEEKLLSERDDIKNKQAEDKAELRKIAERIEEHLRFVNDVEREVSSEERNIVFIEQNIINVQQEIKYANEQIRSCRKSMFDEAFDIIDNAIKKGEGYIDSLKDKQKYAKESIAQYKESIEELKKPATDDGQAALKASLEDYQKKLEEAETAQAEIQAKYNELVQQKAYFTQFKTYLANTKIEAISQIINSFLEEIGSDIRVSIDGYRVLKSGKLSEKITINLLRNGIDCGAYGKFSGGERSRVELASILAIQALTNSACEDSKGLDFVALDEIMEACDFEGISAACDTLNKLHKTALVITQNPIAENYPYQLVVTKQNGVSTIE